MVDPSVFKIGDFMYRVKKSNNSFIRDKITMIDDEGNTWYRYDKPLWTARVDELTLVGLARVSIEGQVQDPPEDVYYFVDATGEIIELVDQDFEHCPHDFWGTDRYFLTVEEANTHKAEFERKNSE